MNQKKSESDRLLQVTENLCTSQETIERLRTDTTTALSSVHSRLQTALHHLRHAEVQPRSVTASESTAVFEEVEHYRDSLNTAAHTLLAGAEALIQTLKHHRQIKPDVKAAVVRLTGSVAGQKGARHG